MRLPRIRFTVRRMMIAVAVMAIATWTFSRYSWGWTDYAAGWWDAECELWRGDVTIYSLGGLRMGDSCNVDEDTGLPINFVCACVIGKGDRERVLGHNDRVNRYIRSHGLPKNTLNPWRNELFGLKAYFDGHTRTHGSQRLLAGGPAVASPDGKRSIRPVAAVKDDGSPSDSLKVIIAAGDAVLGDWYVRFGKGESDMVWGPEGSQFVVIRTIAEKTEHYEAYDLRTCRYLRNETWDDGRRACGMKSKRWAMVETDRPVW